MQTLSERFHDQQEAHCAQVVRDVSSECAHGQFQPNGRPFHVAAFEPQLRLLAESRRSCLTSLGQFDGFLKKRFGLCVFASHHQGFPQAFHDPQAD
jgi:hypothetical protein